MIRPMNVGLHVMSCPAALKLTKQLSADVARQVSDSAWLYYVPFCVMFMSKTPSTLLDSIRLKAGW